MTDKPVLTLRDLSIEFPTSKGIVKAVSALNLEIHKGRRIASSARAARARRPPLWR